MGPLFILLLTISLLVPVFGQETAEDWVKRGNKLCDQGKYSDAIQAYDKALEINPQLSAASTNKVFALRYQRKARPETGTYVKDTGRNGHGELAIINGNHTYDALAVLASLDNEPLIAIFIRSGESFKISGIDDGEYKVYFSLGEVLDRDSDRFIEEGGYYRLDLPIAFETTTESIRDKIKTGYDYLTFWYASWTITLEDASPARKEAALMEPISTYEFPITKESKDGGLDGTFSWQKKVASISKEMKVEEKEVKYDMIDNALLPPTTVSPIFVDRREYDDHPGPGGDLSGIPLIDVNER